MATYKITSASSVLNAAGDAFNTDSAAADTLIVDSDAFLISTGNDVGADLGNQGAWTVNVNGSIFAGTNGIGIRFDNDTPGVSKLTVGADGQVGAEWGVVVHTKTNLNITNAGLIEGDSEAVYLYGEGIRNITNTGTITGGSFSIWDSEDKSTDTVTNSGLIDGQVDLGGGKDKLTNSGTIDGDVIMGAGVNTFSNSGIVNGTVTGGADNDTFSNSKQISGNLDGSGGDDKLTNSGNINGVLDGGSGNDVISNSKTVGDDINASTGDDKVTNSGTVGDDVLLSSGTNIFTNSGTVGDDVTGGTGKDTVTNSKMIGGDVLLSNGDNVLTNSGTISGGVTLGNGNDKFTNTGSVFGFIDLGDGSDTFTGGGKQEVVKDNDGADNYKLGGNDDFYLATGNTGNDSNDTVDGGAGNDSYDGSAAATSYININLDTVDHDRGPITPGAVKVLAKTAQGTDIGGAGLYDTITGFEHFFGTGFADDVHGNASANILIGAGGGDYLFGYAGKDTLGGGDGVDRMVGGAGADMLVGGGTDGDADEFWFVDKTDSGVTVATRDLITDFEDAMDVINLSKIDAKAGGADDAFSFIGVGKSFTSTAGELRAYHTATGWIVDADITGDGKADFSIAFEDPTHAITFSAADFVL